MAQKLSDIYLYLTRRDKTGVRFVAKFLGQELLPTRLDDVESLNLPVNWTNQIKQIIYDSRMLWEPWIESSDSFDDLKNLLKVRGYTNVPINAQPEFSASLKDKQSVNLSNFPKKKTMLRKS